MRRRKVRITKRWGLALGLGLLLVAGGACSFSASTANISSLKLGKDKAITQETGSFSPDDTVYAIAEISNVPDKVKVIGRLSAENVEGIQSGPIPGAEVPVDLPGSGTASFNFKGPGGSWPKGKYKLEVLMLNEGGEQKDQKSASFTVS
jgi:hypothetical protein